MEDIDQQPDAQQGTSFVLLYHFSLDLSNVCMFSLLAVAPAAALDVVDTAEPEIEVFGTKPSELTPNTETIELPDTTDQVSIDLQGVDGQNNEEQHTAQVPDDAPAAAPAGSPDETGETSGDLQIPRKSKPARDEFGRIISSPAAKERPENISSADAREKSRRSRSRDRNTRRRSRSKDRERRRSSSRERARQPDAGGGRLKHIVCRFFNSGVGCVKLHETVTCCSNPTFLQLFEIGDVALLPECCKSCSWPRIKQHQ